MLVATQKRKKKNSTKVNLVVSAIFHGIILAAILYFAARQGLLGKQIKKIAVEMVKEKPKQPEKPKEPEKPKVEVAKAEAPKPAPVEKVGPPKETVTAPPPAASPDNVPAVAPPAAELPAFDFEGGKTVVSTSDPIQVYKGLLENSIRFNWDRPKDQDDHTYVAEVEVSVDPTGDISQPAWKQKSGHKDWDQSVWSAIASTPKATRPPPKNFPARVAVRFDVQPMQPVPQ